MTASHPRAGAAPTSASAAAGLGGPKGGSVPVGSERRPTQEGRPGQEGRATQGEQAIELLERQLAIYQELEELSRRQPALIEADDTDGLLSLLAQRELVLDRLCVLGDELAPLKADWPRVSAGMSGSQRERCRQAIDEIAVVAKALAQRDAADRSALERRRSDVASELAGLSAGRGALSAYGPGRGSSPRYQDREA